jgi:hypothetical protein
VTKPKLLRIGARKLLSRPEAIEQYIILCLRNEDINRLDYLLKALHDGRIIPPVDSPFSARDLKDTVRTCFFGWFATLLDTHDKAVYMFDCLLTLFPEHRTHIVTAQQSMGAVDAELQQFRNSVAFHARASVAAHIAARTNLRDETTSLFLNSAIHDFKELMRKLRGDEGKAVPELPQVLRELGVDRHPAFCALQVGS